MSATPRSPKAQPPKHTTIVFVRHGTTPTTGKILPGRAKGLHLSDQGIAEAQGAAQRVAAYEKIAAIYASPMERTRETAAPIAKAAGVKVSLERGLLECDFGEWTGRELKTLYKEPTWGQVQRTPSTFRFPGGESFAEMQARLSTTVQRIVAAHPGEVVVCVSHADPIKVVVCDAMGAHLDQFQRFQVSPCSATVISYAAGGSNVACLNVTGCLPGAKAPA